MQTGPEMTRAHHPNIVLIVFDALSAASLDQLSDHLPTLTALRNTGVVFENTYACAPESMPARASLFTGLDMAAHGVWTNGVALPKREITIAEAFYQAGFGTWLVGRRHLTGVSNWTTEHARDREYHHFDWAHGALHRSRQNSYLHWLQTTAPDVYSDLFPHHADPDDTDIPAKLRAAMAGLSDALSFNSWVAAQFCARAEQHGQSAPFLGIAGFVVGAEMGAAMGASPGAPSEPLDARALQQADTGIAAILETVPPDSVIAVTSSTGSAGEARQDPMQSAALRVPLIIRAPGQTARRIEPAVSTMDIAPSLYDLAQIVPPKRLQGQSLLSNPPRGWGLSRLRNPDMAHQTALVTERWKLVMTHGQARADARPSYRLFDRDRDPHETHDLAPEPSHADDLDGMIDLMIDARVALEDRTEPRVAKF